MGSFFATFRFPSAAEYRYGPLNVVVRSDMAVHSVGKTFKEDGAFPPAARSTAFRAAR